MGRVYEAAPARLGPHAPAHERAGRRRRRSSRGPRRHVDGASHDSRAIRRGQLFVPVVAERDGHEFIGAALATGAGRLPHLRPTPRAARRSWWTTPSRALQAAGRLARARLPSPVFGITGSVGKTSVKDLLASILSERLVTAASAQSFNNELGVPLTLLNAPDGTQAPWSRWARGASATSPSCATSPTRRSASSRGSRRCTPRSSAPSTTWRGPRASWSRRCPPRGIAILNAGDRRVAAMATRTDGHGHHLRRGRRRAGRGPHARRRAAAHLRAGVAVGAREGHAPGARAAPGGERAGGGGRRARRRASAKPPWCGASSAARCRAGGWSWPPRRAAPSILNDAYNANPTSVAAALESLAALPARRRDRGARRDGRARAIARRPTTPRSARRRASSASASSRSARPGLRRRGRRVHRRGARRARATSATATPSSSRAAGSPASNAWPRRLARRSGSVGVGGGLVARPRSGSSRSA